MNDTRTWNDEQLTEAIKTSTSFNQVFKKLNMKTSGSQHRVVRGRADYLQLDYSHFLGSRANCGPNYKGGSKNKPIEEVLIKYEYGMFKSGSSKIKKRLYKENILKEICILCGQLPIWQGKPLVLRLDHINGDPDDYRLDNLRILCPHCDSQTLTFTGRNKKRKRLIAEGLDPDDPIHYEKKAIQPHKYSYVKPVVKFKEPKPIRFCKNCNNRIEKKGTTYCSDQCMIISFKQHIPSREILEKQIKNGESFLALGKQYKVSDNAVRNWCKSYGLPYKLKDRK